jgi:hypothetical protein
MADATESRRPRNAMEIVVRAMEPADADECTRIVYEAFAGLHDHHRFPRDFPTLEAASQLTGNFIAHPQIWGVVAETDGRIVGSNFLAARSGESGRLPLIPRRRGSASAGG